MENTRTLSEVGQSTFAALISAAESEPVFQVDWSEVAKQVLLEHQNRAISQRVEALEARFPQFAGFRVDHPHLADYRAQIDAALSWQPSAKGLLLVGDHGGGKTRSAFELAKRLMRDERLDVAWWHAQDLAGRLCEAVEFGTDNARGFVEAVAARPVLVIDDLGQEDVNASARDRVAGWLLSLIDKRGAMGRPMIVTTNKSAKQLHSKYGYDRGAALARRLSESCDVLRFGAVAGAESAPKGNADG